MRDQIYDANTTRCVFQACAHIHISSFKIDSRSKMRYPRSKIQDLISKTQVSRLKEFKSNRRDPIFKFQDWRNRKPIVSKIQDSSFKIEGIESGDARSMIEFDQVCVLKLWWKYACASFVHEGSTFWCEYDQVCVPGVRTGSYFKFQD